MKQINLKFPLFFILFLLSNFLSAQNQFDKNKAIDYLNTEFIRTYLEDDYLKKDKNKTEDSIYQQKRKAKLELNTLDNPFPYDSLASVLKNNDFSNSEKKISQRINNLKVENIDNHEKLISAIDALFADQTKISFLKKDSIFQELKNFYAVPDENNESSLPEISETEELPIWKKESTYLWIVLPLLVISLLVLAYTILSKKADINDLKREIKELEKSDSANKNQSNFSNENENWKRKFRDSENENKKLKEKIAQLETIEIVEEKPSPVINLTIATPPEISFFFAGKPNDEMEFSEITNSPIANTSVYKLTYLDREKNLAEFEVQPADGFMLREIVNFPEKSLYRVCENTNLNTEFQSKIITEKKGIAHLINGVWKVKGNDDKAIIKFI